MKITYKPGYEITVEPRFRGRDALLKIRAVVPDSHNPSATTVIQMQTSLDEMDLKDPDRFQARLEYLVRDFEFHEMFEWLKIDGVLVRDPHRKP